MITFITGLIGFGLGVALTLVVLLISVILHNER